MALELISMSVDEVYNALNSPKNWITRYIGKYLYI